MYRISPYHEILYNEWRLNPNSCTYNIVFDQMLSGNLDINRLNKALQRFISDHLIFNSHIVEKNKLLYWVENSKITKLHYIKKKQADNQIHNYVYRAFDLEVGPLYRFLIIRESILNYRIILVFHHILIHGSSFNELITTISNYYNYCDYEVDIKPNKQKELLTSSIHLLYEHLNSRVNINKQFWTNALHDCEPVDLRFIQRNIPLDKSHTQEEIKFEFASDILARLHLLKNKYSISPFMYGLIIFSILINRYTSQQRFAISYPSAIKEHTKLLYGAGINTNIYPSYFEHDSKVVNLIELLKKFIDEVKNGYSYYPINDIIENNNTELLNTFFAQTNFKNTPLKFNDVKTIKINNLFNINHITKLSFEQEINKDRLAYRVNYNKQEIDVVILKQFIEHYKKLFISILSDLEQNITNKLVYEYSVLDLAEYKRIVYTWNSTVKQYKSSTTIHQLFEEQVAKTPDNIALVYENNILTYTELNIKANKLANYIRQNNCIHSDDLILLFLNRSEIILIAILGVLKAGGAYVPIDTLCLDGQIKHIINDTKSKLIVTSENNVSKLKHIIDSSKINIEILSIDCQKILQSLSNQSQHNLDQNSNISNLAYIIYTSGTTGNPKGVMIEHQNVVNLANCMIETMGISVNSKVAQFASYIFDASIFEIFPVILSGASLYIMSKTVIEDTKKTIEFFITNSITQSFLPTAYYKEIHQFLDNTPLKLVHIGGESIHGLKSVPSKYKLLNQYGPTESTVCVTQLYINDIDYAYLGRPIANTAVHILDRRLQPLPVGAIGELYITGAGLARGYLNLPKLTDENFIINHFKNRNFKMYGGNDRLYKTGDFGRYLPDGNIEYIGRNDKQIKINGFRVELSEIEHVLLQYPGINQAVVIIQENLKSNIKYLVGYYVANNKLDETKIINFLSKHLLAHKVPNFLIYLDKLPLTLNGKIDKISLPLPSLKNSKTLNQTPRNEIQKSLAIIYAKTLGLEINEVSINDNFFKLGGNSIKAIKLVSQINYMFNCNIKLSDIFINSDIKNLARRVLYTKNKYTSIIKLNQAPNKPKLFMIHSGYGGCEVYTELSRNLENKYQCYGLEPYNLYCKEKITDLHTLANYYLAEIKRVMLKPESETYLLLGWSVGGIVALAIAAILEKTLPKLKIVLYLFDTIIVDKVILDSSSPRLLRDMKNTIQKSIKLEWDLEYLSTPDLNYKFMQQARELKIKTTNIMLFKANQIAASLVNYKEHLNLYQYILKLKYNNIDLIHENLEKITVFNLNADHYNILNNFSNGNYQIM